MYQLRRSIGSDVVTFHCQGILFCFDHACLGQLVHAHAQRRQICLCMQQRLTRALIMTAEDGLLTQHFDVPASSCILDSAVAPSFVRCSVPFKPLSHNSMKAGSLKSSVARPARLRVSNLPPSSNTGCGSLDAAAADRCLVESVICVLSRSKAPVVLEKLGRVAGSVLAALWGPRT